MIACDIDYVMSFTDTEVRLDLGFVATLFVTPSNFLTSATRTGAHGMTDSPAGSWVQYTYAAGTAGRLSSYTLSSAGDAPERDPADWQLQGSSDGGATWTTVDIRAGVTFSERLQKQKFAVNGISTYKAYRLNITKILNPESASCVQLAEMELLGQQVPG